MGLQARALLQAPARTLAIAIHYMPHRAMTKEQVLETVQQLPDGFVLEDLFERLLFIERVEEGMRQSTNGETLTEDEARSYLSRWQTRGTAALAR